MSDEYTPSTMSIRDVWSFARATTGDGIDHEQARAEFDRWLTGLDAEIRTEAFEDAAAIVEAQTCPVYATDIEDGYLMAVEASAAAIRAAKVDPQ